MRTYNRTLIGASLLTLGGAAAVTAAEKPNVVIFYIDDMGYGDIEPFGSTRHKTPNINRLAEEGVCLTSFYAYVCSSPSRAGLMTGCYPKRVGLGKGINDDVVIFPRDSIGINSSEFTMAEMFKKADYKTACIGKWHLGDQPEFLPTRHGFDYFAGIPYSNDMWTGNKSNGMIQKGNLRQYPPLPIMHGEAITDTVMTMEGQAQWAQFMTNETVQFIENNSDEPMFLYLPYPFVHHPRIASKEFVDRAKLNTSLNENNMLLKAQVEEIDWSVGKIMESLREAGVDKNTIVLFLSDNGGHKGQNGPLRGVKNQTWEGGLRVPAIVWGRGIPAGKTCDELAVNMDLLPTFANLVDVKLPKKNKIDGKDIWSLMSCKEGAKTPHEAFYYFRLDNIEAVRVGDWKLYKNGQLYNLHTDIRESKNVADQNPDVVAKLTKYLEDGDREFNDPKNIRKPGIVNDPQLLVQR